MKVVLYAGWRKGRNPEPRLTFLAAQGDLIQQEADKTVQTLDHLSCPPSFEAQPTKEWCRWVSNVEEGCQFESRRGAEYFRMVGVFGEPRLILLSTKCHHQKISNSKVGSVEDIRINLKTVTDP